MAAREVLEELAHVTSDKDTSLLLSSSPVPSALNPHISRKKGAAQSNRVRTCVEEWISKIGRMVATVLNSLLIAPYYHTQTVASVL